MEFTVPTGSSTFYDLNVYPKLPSSDGEAIEWDVFVLSGTESEGPIVGEYNVIFEGQSEFDRHHQTCTLVFTIPDDAQTTGFDWSFSDPGFICKVEDDDHDDDVRLTLSNNNKTLTATITCFADHHDVNFSFLALHRNQLSGRCKIYASKDPRLQIHRPV
jgi:hypothetical protein